MSLCVWKLSHFILTSGERMEFLRFYLLVATLVEVVAFVRLVFTDVPFTELLPTVTDVAFDAVPTVRHLYATYALTLAAVRFMAACDMTNRSLFVALIVVHVIETAFSVAEVFVFAAIPLNELFTPAHAPKAAGLAILIAQMMFIATGYYRYVGRDAKHKQA
ncbi:hypothetical protein ACHHYP_03089 [Achlya hypogyna]|uniref:Transmembrane protein n=1 Tax=Achlya hypogyna TaxID=1202772 RepID=A0A1V9Z506_ACHHY|nr:hypothetical protein ACHHYP_03089 [Achlya hypogyna]